MKSGYHYTSLNNWINIQKQGVINTYPIEHSEISEFFPNGVNGIFVWENFQRGASHAGSLLWHMANKGTADIVLLRVLYRDTDCLQSTVGGRFVVHHLGSIGNWEYHKGADTAVILTGKVGLSRITAVKRFNIVQLLTE